MQVSYTVMLTQILPTLIGNWETPTKLPQHVAAAFMQAMSDVSSLTQQHDDDVDGCTFKC